MSLLLSHPVCSIQSSTILQYATYRAIIETIDIIIGVLHDALTPVLLIPTVTHHIADHLCTGAHQLTLKTAADHNRILCTNPVRKPCINLHPIPTELKANCMMKEIQKSQ